MPDTLVAPAAPAVSSSPAPSAPAVSSTPATPATPAESTTATTLSPTETTQTGATETAAQPVTADWKGKPRPKTSDFEGDIAKQMTAMDEWEAANPEGEVQPAVSVEEKTPEQIAAEIDSGTEVKEQPSTVESVSPEELAGWAKEDPELNAWLEKNPGKKGKLFRDLRELEELRPYGEMFATPDDATRALAADNRVVSIKSAFEGAVENPATIGDAVTALLDEFLIVDDKGNPLLDADGERQYGEDAKLMADYFADAKYDAMTGELKEAIASGKLNEHQKQNYEAALQAWEYLKKFNATSDFERGLPDEDQMDEGTRNWVNQERQRIKEEQERLDGNQRTQQTAEQKAAQATYSKANKVNAAKHFGGEMDKLVKATLDSGAYIPEFLLKEIDPVTKVNTFVYGIYDRFMMDTIGWSERQKRYIPGKGIPRLKEQYLRLSAAKPSEANQNAMSEFFGKTVADHLPKIYNARLKEIQAYSRSERNSAAGKTSAARSHVAPEVAGGSAGRPNGMLTEQQASKQAATEIDKEFAGKYLDGGTRLAKIIERTEKLMGGR